MNANIIQSAAELAEFTAAAARAGWVALDTEFLRERTYAPELCLIQMAGASAAACADPLAVADLAALDALLADAAVVKIFHSCRQDLEALDTRFAVRARNLYDTQLAAAFCGFGAQVSYAQLVEAVCAVHLPKSHTRTDWSRRPLSDAQLDYAMDDVKYLPELRDELDRRLAEKGRDEWHRDECARAAAPENYRLAADDAWLRLRGIERLDAAGQACARRLAAWREGRAQRRNLPRGWIMPTPVLLQICRRRPKTPQQLAKIKDIAPRTAKRAGKEILAVVAGDDAGNSAPPPPQIKSLTAGQRRRAREIMTLLEERADEQEISRALITNRQEVERFVRGDTALSLFSGWRGRLIGDEIRARFGAE